MLGSFAVVLPMAAPEHHCSSVAICFLKKDVLPFQQHLFF
jgi:hypothetical protein